MHKIILLISFFLLGAFLKNATAQAILIWDDIEESTFTIWAKNNFPCHINLTAEAKFLDQQLHRHIPKGAQRKLAQLSIDSMQAFTNLEKKIRYNISFGNPNAIHNPNYRYLLPYPQGTSHLLIQGNNSSFTHNQSGSRYAFDFQMPENSLITAARGGTVGFIDTNNKKGGTDEQFIHQANKIIICHDDGTIAVYAHLQHKGNIVKIGDHVFAGQAVGFSGNTGYSTTPHLHFVVLAGSDAVPIIFKTLPDSLPSGHFYEQKLIFNN